MSRFEAIASAIVRHLVPVGEEVASDILLTATDAATRKTRWGQVVELAGLTGLGLRLRGSRATDNDRKEIVLQGVGLGGAYVLAATIMAIWVDFGPTLSDGPSTTLLGLIVMLAASILAPSRRVRLSAVLLATILAFGLAGSTTTPVRAGLLIGAVLTIGGTFGKASARQPLGLIGIGLAALTTEALALSISGGGWINESTLAVVAAIGPLGLLTVGWFDPRWALTATAVWFWRLAAFDLGDLVSAVEVAGQDLSLNAVLARWLIMGTGVLVGLTVSQRAVRRATAL